MSAPCKEHEIIIEMQVNQNIEDIESYRMSSTTPSTLDEMMLQDRGFIGSLNSLPDEIIEFILTYLPPYGDLKNCSLVCKRWHTIVKNLVRRSKLNLHKGLLDYRLQWELFSQQTAASTMHAPSTSLALFPHTTLPIIAGRFSHSAVFYNNSMYIFGGGSSSDTTFNDLWRFDLTRMSWERPVSMGNYPSPKGSASMVQWREQLVLFGGWRYPSLHPPYQPWCLFDELHFYDIPSQRWNLCTPQPSPPPMAGHSATVHGNRMIVFGGYQISDGVNSNSNETWCFELELLKWWQPRIVGSVKPPPRYGQFQLMLDEQHLLIVGGCGGPNAVYSDAWLLDMSKPYAWTWRTLSVRNKEFAASHIWCNPACKIDNKLVVLGPSPHMPQDFQLKKQLPRLAGGVQRNPHSILAFVMGRNGNEPPMHGELGIQRNHAAAGGDILLPRGFVRDEHYYANRRAILNQHQQNGLNNNYQLFNNRNNNNNHRNNNNNNNNNINNNNNYNMHGNLQHVLQPRTGRLSELHAVAEEQNRPSASNTAASTSATTSSSSSSSPSTSKSASTSRLNGPVVVLKNGTDKEAANRLQRNLALRCREHELLLPKRFDELYEDPPRMAAFKEQSSPRSQSKDHNERIRRLEEKMNAIRSRRNALNNEVKTMKEPSPKRVKRNVLSLFVCDLTGALDEKEPHLEWVEYKNYGIIPGAPERLILSTMVAGHGELILFGGVHKETLSELTHQVSNTIHFLSAPRDIV